MDQNKSKDDSETADSSTSQPALPAVPPPDDPLHRSEEFDPDREYKSREMARKRLAAIRKTREMPTAADEEAAEDKTSSEEKTDST